MKQCHGGHNGRFLRVQLWSLHSICWCHRDQVCQSRASGHQRRNSPALEQHLSPKQLKSLFQMHVLPHRACWLWHFFQHLSCQSKHKPSCSARRWKDLFERVWSLNRPLQLRSWILLLKPLQCCHPPEIRHVRHSSESCLLATGRNPVMFVRQANGSYPNSSFTSKWSVLDRVLKGVTWSAMLHQSMKLSLGCKSTTMYNLQLPCFSASIWVNV